MLREPEPPPKLDNPRFLDWVIGLRQYVRRREAKTWTPTLTFATAGDLSVSYSTRWGMYTKIGALVIVHFRIATSAFTHTTASGNLQVTGLPFPSLNVSDFAASSAITFGGITKANYTSIAAQLANNSSTIVFNASGSGVAADPVTAANMPTGGTVLLRGSLTYFTDNNDPV